MAVRVCQVEQRVICEFEIYGMASNVMFSYGWEKSSLGKTTANSNGRVSYSRAFDALAACLIDLLSLHLYSTTKLHWHSLESLKIAVCRLLPVYRVLYRRASMGSGEPRKTSFRTYSVRRAILNPCPKLRGMCTTILDTGSCRFCQFC